MNKGLNSINTYQDLLAEKDRLELLIANQKNIVRHDLDELKAEFKKEIKPAVEAASFVKKIMAPQHRKETILTNGANIAIDVLSSMALGKANILVRLLLPKVIKKYTSIFLQRNIAAKKNGKSTA